MIQETIKSILKFLILLLIYIICLNTANAYTNNVYLTLLIPTLIIIFISYFTNKKELKSSLKNIKKDFNIKLFLLGIFTCILSIALNYILTKTIGHTSTNQSSIIDNIAKYKLLYALLIVVIIPFGEECLYRLPYSNSKNRFSFIFSTLIFASLHLNEANEFIYIIAYLLPSIGITLNYFKTNNIYISYLLHVLNNLINVLLLIW